MGKIGKFYIDENFVREYPGQVFEIFAALRAIVVRAEMLYHMRRIEYFAISPFFAEIREGMTAPEYVLTFELFEDGDRQSVLHIQAGGYQKDIALRRAEEDQNDHNE